MPFYTGLKKFLEDPATDLFIQEYKDPKAKLEQIVKNILNLKNGIRLNNIPLKTVSNTLLLATWNLREFDSNSKKHGPRLEESFYYIAEIISNFDIVALQEIRQDLAPLKRVLRILGPGWDFLVTDVTEGSSGNGERMAFVFDKSKVIFTNIAGEVVLPTSNRKKDLTQQFARTPYLVSFQAGWLKLNLCTVHMYFGSAKTMQRRIKEIADISQFFKRRSLKDKENYILLGDFNIPARHDETMAALLKGGFKIPPELQKTKGSNLDKSKFYDQIVYREKKGDIQFTQHAGVFDFYQYVFSDADISKYVADFNILRKFNKKKKIKLTEKVYKEWKTFQMSDHLPLWVEFKIDFSAQYLEQLPSILGKSN